MKRTIMILTGLSGLVLIILAGFNANLRTHLTAGEGSAPGDIGDTVPEMSERGAGPPLAPPIHTATPEPAAEVMYDYDADRPLPAAEEEQFFAEIEDLFAKRAPSLVNPEAMTPYLKTLNARRRAGVRSILNSLERPSTSDAEAERKLPYVDYLVYRAQWDPAVRSDIVQLAKKPLTINNPRYLGTRIIENAELLAGLARYDLDQALRAVASLDEGIAKRYAAAAVHDLLFDQGASWDEATQKIGEYIHGYERRKS